MRAARRRSRRTRFASLVLCLTFMAAHPAMICAALCLAQGHELPFHQAGGAMPGHHHQGGTAQAPCHARQLTTPHLAIALSLPPALPTPGAVPLPPLVTVSVPWLDRTADVPSNPPSIQHPPPRPA